MTGQPQLHPLRCNRIGCNKEATYQGPIGNPSVMVALCYDHAVENAERRKKNVK